MTKDELKSLLSLAMSDQPVNWNLFHCFELQDKLSALDLFFSETINNVPMIFKDNAFYYTYLVFGTYVRYFILHKKKMTFSATGCYVTANKDLIYLYLKSYIRYYDKNKLD